MERNSHIGGSRLKRKYTITFQYYSIKVSGKAMIETSIEDLRHKGQQNI